jgi:hypothetical protein
VRLNYRREENLLHLLLGHTPLQEPLAMRNRYRSHLAAVALLLVSATARAADPVAVRLLDLESVVGASWEPEPPTSTMRLLQYRVAGAGGAGSATFVVYYFGAGQGGSNAANIERWQSQFTTADGGPVEPVITTSKAGDVPVTLVELRGSYARSLGMGQGVDAQPDQTLLAAIVETPKGNLFAQLHGPTATVAPARGDFEAFLVGLKPVARP